mgnify:FL=1
MAGDAASREVRSQIQKAYPLAIVATLSPLLGLLGTVLGMIQSFDMVALAGSLGDASTLAGGISLALITTQGGLMVAVPALGFQHIFKSRTLSLGLELEEAVTEVLSRRFGSSAP